MEFSNRLNSYIEALGCTAKELANVSGVSAAAISRYRTGDRTPDPGSAQLRMLAVGIAELSEGRFAEQGVYDELALSISGLTVDYEGFLFNLTSLLEALPASNNELARAISFDPSYISRILSGQRRPADMRTFVAGVAQFAARRCVPHAVPDGVKALPGSSWVSIVDENARARAISSWLVSSGAKRDNPIGGFLEKLDAFDLDDFIRIIHFDEISIPTAPFQLPTTKTYQGISEMMECELDFLKAAVFARATDDVIMYSDMPLEEMAADPEFPKKWMFGMAAMLKKGLRLRNIHNTGRPLAEMMLGLESWIPMYMTGQVLPYYLDHMHNDVFCHLLKVSGTAAMQGEAIAGYQGEGRYILTKNRDEVRYYRQRAERMLEKAHPLMRIITAENAAELAAFQDANAREHFSQRFVMSTLPIATIPPHVLERIMNRARLAEADREDVRAYARAHADRMAMLLENHDIRLEVPQFTREEFEGHPAMLELSGLFRELSVPYAYEDYAEHLVALRAAVADRPNVELVVDSRSPFRNIQIAVCEGRYALVSKGKSPVIHFLIEHPQMVAAFARFSAPISD